MIKLQILIFIIVCILGSHQYIWGQNTFDIVIGKKIKFHSSILSKDREILIALPDSYGDNNYTKYPVLYLLDGDKFFNSFSSAAAQMSSDASPQIPEMIIIGITSQDRIKDSSPTHSKIGYSGKEEKGYEMSGGADDFLKFIDTELVPYVDKTYRTNFYRTFVGYSFTGLPILHSLFKKPSAFNSYLVIDFSAWWDNEVTLKNMKSFFENYQGSNKDVFISTIDIVKNDVYKQENKTWNFIQDFEQQHPSAINFGYKKYGYKEENHHSMPLVSFIDGVKYIFRDYMINYDEMFSTPQKIETRFNNLSERLGYKVLPREDLINYFGYQFLRQHPDIDKALFYLNYNAKNYPLSSNVWDSLAEAYVVKGDKAKAIEYYTKSLQLGSERTDLLKVIDELKKNK